MNKLSNTISSFTYLPKAFTYLLSRPKLYPYLALPLFLNLILTTLLSVIIFNALSGFITSLLSFNILTSISYIDDIINVVSFVVTFIISAYLSLSLAIIIQAPFNGMIAEKIFEEKGVSDNVNLSVLKMIIYDIKRSIKYEIQKLLLTASILMLTLLLNLIPVIGNILFVMINSISAYIFNLVDVFDPAYSRFDYSLKTKIVQSIKSIERTAGIGIPLYFVINIPIVNFLLLPIVFTGSALMIADMHEKSQS